MRTAIVIDDHQLFAGGFSHLLSAIATIDSVDCFVDPQSTVDSNLNDSVSLIVSDLYIPGYNMYVWFPRLKERFPLASLLVVSSSISRSDRMDCLSAGADLYIEKHADPDLLIEGITHLLLNKPLKDDFLNRTAVEAQEIGLTNKQIDILVHLARGLSLKEIAVRFHISPETVKSHLSRIYETIGVSGRSAASIWAKRHGLL